MLNLVKKLYISGNRTIKRGSYDPHKVNLYYSPILCTASRAFCSMSPLKGTYPKTDAFS